MKKNAQTPGEFEWRKVIIRDIAYTFLYCDLREVLDSCASSSDIISGVVEQKDIL